MKCNDCHDLLQAILDGVPVPDRHVLDRHLRDCPDCRGLHAAAVSLEEGLRLYTPPAPPWDFAAVVTNRVLADRLARRRMRRRWFIAAALAASLLLVLWAAFPSGTQAPVAHVPPTSVGPNETPGTETAPPSPIDLVSQSRSAVAALPRRVAKEAPSVPSWTLPADVLPEPPPAGPEALEQATASLTEARQGAALAWQAVESPVRRATSVWSRLTPALQKE